MDGKRFVRETPHVGFEDFSGGVKKAPSGLWGLTKLPTARGMPFLDEARATKREG
jgi:hypothetical protein